MNLELIIKIFLSIIGVVNGNAEGKFNSLLKVNKDIIKL